MSNESEFRTSFTFRIACNEINRISSQLSGLTSQVKAVGGSIDSTQVAIDRKRKELRALMRKIGSRKKTLEKLRKRAERASVKSGKQVDITTISITDSAEDDINTTFATEDMSIAATSVIKSPSSHKRKRFAGIWDDVNVDMEINAAHVDKRARLDMGNTSGVLESNGSKENIEPCSETQPEAGSSRLPAIPLQL